MDKYEKGPVLGTGTFGSVFKATHKETGQVVAVKKINLAPDSKEGVNVTALREIKLLKELHHPHIIGLLDVFPIKKNIALVFEFMDSDLEAIIKDRSIILSPADIKAYMGMLMSALEACHAHYVVHRDVKPNNLLLAPTGELKLADFGLSRLLHSPERDRGRPYTNQVFARWYRAPELLFGSTLYGFAVDVWAAGCIFAELLLRRPWLPGDNDIDQLGKIFQALGTPSESNWPGVTALPGFVEFQPVTAPPLKALIPKASDDALELLSHMCSLDPSKRPTAGGALKHRYFSSDPPPTLPSRLPRPALRENNPLMQHPAAAAAAPAPAAAAASGAGEDAGERAPKRRALATGGVIMPATGTTGTLSPPVRS